MGTTLLNVSTVDGHWESFLPSYSDFEIKAVSFVPAVVPWLSNFSIVVEECFSVFSFVLTSASAQSFC